MRACAMRGEVMKVLRLVVLLLAVVGGAYAVRRLVVARQSEVLPLDMDVPLTPVPDAGVTL